MILGWGHLNRNQLSYLTKMERKILINRIIFICLLFNFYFMIPRSPFNDFLVQAQEKIIEKKILTGFMIELGYTLSCEDGRKLALTEAKNKALADVGTYLFRTSIVDFGTLTKDKVIELTGGYMSTKELRFECDGKKATVEIESLVKIDVEELKKRIAEIIEREKPSDLKNHDLVSPSPGTKVNLPEPVKLD